MRFFSPAETFSAYNIITSIDLPTGLTPGLELEAWSLLCSVHPKLPDILDSCVKVGLPGWYQVNLEVNRQKDIRFELYQWLSHLDKNLREDPSFVFPDPYSLILWLWTFQIFESVIAQQGEQWGKYFYRGEAQDFGKSQFMSTMARQGVLGKENFSSLQSRHAAITSDTYIQAACADTLGVDIAHRLLKCMSLSQSIAVCQHYNQPTPLLDVTTNPEIALYFATQHCDSEIGVVGYWKSSGHNDECKNLALIMAPLCFERLHRQSGYFICVPPDTSATNIFVKIHFRHCPDLEPVRPKCLASIGKCTGSDEEIIGDPWNISKIIGGVMGITREKAPLGRPSDEHDTGVLLNNAISSICSATSCLRVGQRGRALEIHGNLIYTLYKYAPHHFLFYTKVFETKSDEPKMRPLRELPEKIYEILRYVITGSISSSALIDIKDEELLDYLMREQLPLLEDLTFPVKDWYE